MSYYLVGIGGTGARCLEAFINLNGAGLLKDNQDVKILFVDADKSCGNLIKTQATAELYNHVQHINFGENDLFKNKIIPFEAWSPVPENCDNLDIVFERVGLSNKEKYKPLSLLYDSLFTEQERKTNLEMGFRGHPAIGAAVMSQAMDASSSKVWKEVIQKINADKDAKIFLFASVFGGTGAAGFPTIARILHNSLKKDEAGNSIANIGGALVLPYFQFPAPSDGSSREMQAKVSEFMINTKAALSYYVNSDLVKNRILKKIYLLGDNDLADVSNFSLGSQSQKNAAHFIELYAALAAFDFFNRSEYEGFETPMCARGDDTNKIEWDDIPDVGDEFKNKLKAYIKFLCIYKNLVYENLEDDRKIPIAKGMFSFLKKKRHSWEITLLEEAGKVDIANTEVWQNFETLKEYSDMFLRWLEQVESNDKRQIDLVKKDIFDANSDSQTFDYNEILNDNNIKDTLTEGEVTRSLSKYSAKDAKSNSGVGILLNALYEICK